MYYFISDQNFNQMILDPRVPANRSRGEDQVTKRICVSKSILGCIVSNGIFRKHKTLYIHRCDYDNAYTPTIEQVNDVMFSGEEWICGSVMMHLVDIVDVERHQVTDEVSCWDFRDRQGRIKFRIHGINSEWDIP